MPLFKVHDFLEEVLSYIRFPFGKNDIRLELENHLLEKIEDYEEEGYVREMAEELAINDMGDSEEIGMQLNKQHNPFLGWVLITTNVVVVIVLVYSLFFVGGPMISSLSGKNFVNEIPKENIVYKIDLNEEVKIDDTILRFTNVIYEKDGDMNIFYEYYDTRLWGTGWRVGGLGDIKDNLGNTYFSGSSGESGGIKVKGWKRVSAFLKDADTLIIDYDYYNRKYRVEIPLEGGGSID